MKQKADVNALTEVLNSIAILAPAKSLNTLFVQNDETPLHWAATSSSKHSMAATILLEQV